MDPTIIGTIIGSQAALEFVKGWFASRSANSQSAAKRLDKLESDVATERQKNESTNAKLFDLAVKHEGLKVHFDLLQVELKDCRERLHGKDSATSDRA